MAGLERPWALGCAPGFHLSDKYLLCSRPRFHTEGKMVERTRGFRPSRVCVLVRRPRKQNKAAAAFVTHDRLDKSPGKRRGVQRIRNGARLFKETSRTMTRWLGRPSSRRRCLTREPHCEKRKEPSAWWTGAPQGTGSSID